MEPEEIQSMKESLTNQLQELLRRGDETVYRMRKDRLSATDPFEQASMDENRDVLLSIRNRESQLINEIKLALRLIENGTFGICETCEEEISVERLKASPFTTQCIICKSKSESLK